MDLEGVKSKYNLGKTQVSATERKIAKAGDTGNSEYAGKGCPDHVPRSLGRRVLSTLGVGAVRRAPPVNIRFYRTIVNGRVRVAEPAVSLSVYVPLAKCVGR